jgi:transcriptional regulator with XRE-family HTH domain
MKFRIRELAKARGLTMEDLAIKSGIKYSTVKNLWQGRTLDPSYSTLRAVAFALGVPIEQLEDRTEPGPFVPALLQAA